MNQKDPVYKLHHKDVVLRAEKFLHTLKRDDLKYQSERTFDGAEDALEYGVVVIRELLELIEGGPE